MSWRFCNAQVKFSLPPSELYRCRGYLEESILSPGILRYSREARGVVVAYTEPDLAGNTAEIDGTSPYVHINAKVDLLVFSPPKGTLLIGVISYIGAEFLGLKVYGTMYAVISRQNAPQGFIFQADPSSDDPQKSRFWERVEIGAEEDEMGDALPFSEGTILQVKTKVAFRSMALLHTKSGLFQIKGTLLGEGCTVLEEANTVMESEAKKKRKESRVSLLAKKNREAFDDDPLLAMGDVFGDPLAELTVAPEGAAVAKEEEEMRRDQVVLDRSAECGTLSDSDDARATFAIHAKLAKSVEAKLAKSVEAKLAKSVEAKLTKSVEAKLAKSVEGKSAASVDGKLALSSDTTAGDEKGLSKVDEEVALTDDVMAPLAISDNVTPPNDDVKASQAIDINVTPLDGVKAFPVIGDKVAPPGSMKPSRASDETVALPATSKVSPAIDATVSLSDRRTALPPLDAKGTLPAEIKVAPKFDAEVRTLSEQDVHVEMKFPVEVDHDDRAKKRKDRHWEKLKKAKKEKKERRKRRQESASEDEKQKRKKHRKERKSS